MSLKKFLIVFIICICSTTFSQNVPLGQDNIVKNLDQELSGEAAKRNLEFISRQHRMRGSVGYNKATDFIAQKLKNYGYDSVELIKIPTDGKTMYGTQKSRRAWNAEFAELWEMEEQNGKWVPKEKIADWESIPLVLAQDSNSAKVQASLVDIGAGTSEDDYSGVDVKGKLVLTSSQPGAVLALAIEKYGAVGILSYAQNQVTAWWKEDENLIRWGHVGSFTKTNTFGFMLSLKQARKFQQRLDNGETITLNAEVIAGQEDSSYNILTAVIEGSNPNLKNEEIAFTCHLDHPRPGANDNASGCVTILEVARTLKKLIAENKIAPPGRTIRFIWSPEIEGTTALLNYRPELAERIKFNIHMDMVGGGPETKAIFHVSKSPQSLPSFINDVGEAFGRFINISSDRYASGVNVAYPMVSEEGGKEALQSVLGEFNMGSDFQVFSEGSFRIPAIYLHDWPDRYIHTNYDVPANIDPTKLKRAGFIGAASAYYLSRLNTSDVPHLISLLKRQVLKRSSEMLDFSPELSASERDNKKYYFWQHEQEVFNSIMGYATISNMQKEDYTSFLSELKKSVGPGEKSMLDHDLAATVYSRNPEIKGPMSVFGFDYFFEHYDSEKETPGLYSYQGLSASGYQYSYEVLNLVNGKRDAREIRNIVSAEFGPVPLNYVIEYLEALKSIKVIY